MVSTGNKQTDTDSYGNPLTLPNTGSSRHPRDVRSGLPACKLDPIANLDNHFYDFGMSTADISLSACNAEGLVFQLVSFLLMLSLYTTGLLQMSTYFF